MVENYKAALQKIFVDDPKTYYAAYTSSGEVALDFNDVIASSRSLNRAGAFKLGELKGTGKFAKVGLPDYEDKVAHLIKFWNHTPSSKFNDRLSVNYYTVLIDTVMEYAKYESTKKGSGFDPINLAADKKAKLLAVRDRFDDDKMSEQDFAKESKDIVQSLSNDGEPGVRLMKILSTVENSARFYINLHAKSSIDTLSYLLWNVFGSTVKDYQYSVEELERDKTRLPADKVKAAEDTIKTAKKFMTQERIQNFAIFQYTLFYQLSLVWIVCVAHHKVKKEDANNAWFLRHQLPSTIKMFRSNPVLDDVPLDDARSREFMSTFADKCKAFMESRESTTLFEMLSIKASEDNLANIPTLSEAIDKVHNLCKAKHFEVFDLLGWDLFSLKDPIFEDAHSVIKKALAKSLFDDQEDASSFEDGRMNLPDVETETRNKRGDEETITDEDNKKSLKSLKDIVKKNFENDKWLDKYSDSFKALEDVMTKPEFKPMIQKHNEFVSKYDLIYIQNKAEEEINARNLNSERSRAYRDEAVDGYYKNISAVISQRFKVASSKERFGRIEANWSDVYTANGKALALNQDESAEIDNLRVILYPYCRYNFFLRTSKGVDHEEVVGFYVDQFVRRFAKMYSNGLLYRYFWAQVLMELARMWKEWTEKKERGAFRPNNAIASSLQDLVSLGIDVDPFQLYQLYYRRRTNTLDKDPVFMSVVQKQKFSYDTIKGFLDSPECQKMLFGAIEAGEDAGFSGSLIDNVLTLAFSTEHELKDVERVMPFHEPTTTGSEESRKNNARDLFSYLIDNTGYKRGSGIYNALAQSVAMAHGIEETLVDDEEAAEITSTAVRKIQNNLVFKKPNEVSIIDYTIDYLIADSSKTKSIKEVKEIVSKSGTWSKSYARYFKRKLPLDFDVMIKPCLDFTQPEDPEDINKAQEQVISRIFWSSLAQSDYVQLLFLSSPAFSKKYDEYHPKIQANLRTMIDKGKLDHNQLLSLGKFNILLSMYDDIRKKGLDKLYELTTDGGALISTFSGSLLKSESWSAKQKQLLSHLEALTTLVVLFDVDTTSNGYIEYLRVMNSVTDANNALSVDDAVTIMGYSFSIRALLDQYPSVYNMMVLAFQHSPRLASKINEMDKGSQEKEKTLTSLLKERIKLTKILSTSQPQSKYSKYEFIFTKSVVCGHPVYDTQLDLILPSLAHRRTGEHTHESLISEDEEIKGSTDNKKRSTSKYLPAKIRTLWFDLGFLVDTRGYFNSLQLLFTSYNIAKLNNGAKSHPRDSLFDLRVLRELPGLQRAFTLTKKNRLTNDGNASENSRSDVITKIDTILKDRTTFDGEVFYGYYTILPEYREITYDRESEYTREDSEEEDESESEKVEKFIDFDLLVPKIQVKGAATSLSSIVLEPMRSKLVESYKVGLWNYNYNPTSVVKLWIDGEATWSTTGVGRKNYKATPLQSYRKIFDRKLSADFDKTTFENYFYVPTNDGFVDPHFDGSELSRVSAYDWSVHNVLKAVSDIRFDLEALDKAAKSKTASELEETLGLLTSSAVSLLNIILDTWNPKLVIQLFDEMITFSNTDETGNVQQLEFKTIFQQLEESIATHFGEGKETYADYEFDMRHFNPETLLDYIGVTKGRIMKLADHTANANKREVRSKYLNHSRFTTEALMDTVMGLKLTTTVELYRFMIVCLQNTTLEQKYSAYQTNVEYTQTKTKTAAKKKTEEVPEAMEIDQEGGKSKGTSGDSVAKIKSITYSLGKKDVGMFGLHAIVRTVWGDLSKYHLFDKVTLNVNKIVTNALRIVDMAVETGLYTEVPEVKQKKPKAKGEDAMQL